MNDQLIHKIRACPSLPSLPTIAVQVLDLAQREDVDIAEIARIISKDPALSSKLLRTVNSSFYGRSQHVSTISHSLVILGLQSVKSLVLGFSLVSNLSKNKTTGFKHMVYWKRSIFAATAARSLAAKLGLVQAEEAFLSALLMDIGMLVLDQVLEPGQYGLLTSAAKTHSELSALESRSLETTHAEVGGVLAQLWKLPPLLCVPIMHHHSSACVNDPALKKLTEIVWFGGRCADVFVDADPAAPLQEIKDFLAREHQFGEEDCNALLDDIGKRTREVATLFELNLGPAVDFAGILKKANEALVEISLHSQAQANRLEVQNKELTEKVNRDGLTGLANREAFDEYFRQQFSLAVQHRKPISLIMLDIDKFKFVNDTFGHPGGDAVLKTIGKLLASAARPEDLAARYGGEELVLVLPNTTRQIATAIAETIRRATAARPASFEGASIPITTSIGVATYEPGCVLTSTAHLVKAADLALYNAKHAGRNCVKVFALPKPAARPSAA